MNQYTFLPLSAPLRLQNTFHRAFDLSNIGLVFKPAYLRHESTQRAFVRLQTCVEVKEPEHGLARVKRQPPPMGQEPFLVWGQLVKGAALVAHKRGW